MQQRGPPHEGAEQHRLTQPCDAPMPAANGSRDGCRSADASAGIVGHGAVELSSKRAIREARAAALLCEFEARANVVIADSRKDWLKPFPARTASARPVTLMFGSQP